MRFIETIDHPMFLPTTVPGIDGGQRCRVCYD